MSVPKSIVKMKKGEVTYTSSVDYAQYCIQELVRGALRDVGKVMRSKYRTYFYQATKRHSGLAGAALQYWVRKQEGDLQLGLWKTTRPAKGFWGGFYEIGSDSPRVPKLNIMYNMVESEVQTIIDIESKYLTALNNDDPLSGMDISEDDYESED